MMLAKRLLQICGMLVVLLLGSAMTASAQPPGATSLNSAFPSPSHTFSWHRVDGATWYYVWVNDASGAKYTVWYTAEQTHCAASEHSCWITIPLPWLQQGEGTWWVQTWNPSGFGLWSAAQNFPIRPAQAPSVVDAANKFVGVLNGFSMIIRNFQGLPAQMQINSSTGFFLGSGLSLWFEDVNCHVDQQAYAPATIPDSLQFTGHLGSAFLVRGTPVYRGMQSRLPINTNGTYGTCDESPSSELFWYQPVTRLSAIPELGGLTTPFTVVR